MTDRLPRAVSPADRLYLRPRLGPDADISPELELVVRRGDGAVERAAATPETLRRWAEAQDPAVAERLRRLVEGCRRARPPVAGIALDRPLIMGVVNVTPDSFSDGGEAATAEAAIARGRALVAGGADIIDIGGESTRPGAAAVADDEELARVLPVIEGLADCGRPISIDTRKARVMRAAVAAGAAIINDISALSHDSAALAVAAGCDAGVVLMHGRGDPATMQQRAEYDDVVLDVFDYLEARVAACAAAGIPAERLIVDPGIGFGKTAAHNLELLRGLSMFRALGCPVLLGASRKSFIGKLAGVAEPGARLPGSLAAALWGLGQGADILRVHDVAETVQAVALWRAMAGHG